MAWYVRFIPNECDSVSVLVNNEYWTRWFRTSGEQTVLLPPRFRDVPRLKIGATVAPEDKNGTIKVLWDDRVVKTYDFDNYEDHDVNNAPPPPHDHDHTHGPLRNITVECLPGDNVDKSTVAKENIGESVQPFSSGVLTITSHFPETQARSSIALPVDNSTVAVAAQSKTFRRWDIALPWHLRSVNGTDLADWNALTVTLLRATDPQTGVSLVQGTCAFRQTAHGWHVPQWPSPAGGGLNVRIAFLDSRDGLLESWAVTNNQVVTCADAAAYFTFKQSLRPDWYDILSSVAILVDPNTWYGC